MLFSRFLLLSLFSFPWVMWRPVDRLVCISHGPQDECRVGLDGSWPAGARGHLTVPWQRIIRSWNQLLDWKISVGTGIVRLLWLVLSGSFQKQPPAEIQTIWFSSLIHWLFTCCPFEGAQWSRHEHKYRERKMTEKGEESKKQCLQHL